MCIVFLFLCIYVVIIYSLLELVFHVRISHILLQNDLKRQFFFGGFAPIPSNFIKVEWKPSYMKCHECQVVSFVCSPAQETFDTRCSKFLLCAIWIEDLIKILAGYRLAPPKKKLGNILFFSPCWNAKWVFFYIVFWYRIFFALKYRFSWQLFRLCLRS